MSAGTTIIEQRPRTAAEPAAPGLARLVRVELRKSWDTRAGRWLLAVTGLAVLGVVALMLFAGDPGDRRFGAYLAGTQLPIGVLLPVLGVLLVTSEWSQRTALTTFALVPRRSRVLTAKLLASAVLAVVGVAVALAVSAAGTALTPALGDTAADWSTTGAQLGQVLLVDVVFLLGGAAFGMLLLSSPLAIVLYFVLPIVSNLLVTSVGALHWVRDWLDLSTTTLPMFEGTLDGQGWLQVGTSTALWVVLPIVVGWLRIERAEIS
jgi:ABC-2 type transport system permease protein